MKNERIKHTVQGMALMAVILSLSFTAVAATISKQITVSYPGVKLVVKGQPVLPKDSAGKVVEPFIYQGTTYLPVRAVGQALGEDVSWDATTSTVYIGENTATTKYLVDVAPAYQSAGKPYYVEYKAADNAYFQMSATNYTNGFTLKTSPALYNLNGKYTIMTFTFGFVDTSIFNYDTVYKIYLDGKLVETLSGKADAMPKEYTIALDGAKQMKIEPVSALSEFGFANVAVK